MTYSMLSFRADETDTADLRRWSERLGIGRSELMRTAIRKYLSSLAASAEVESYQTAPMTNQELALAEAADWGPSEDWSDWSDAAR